jgi:hypothetical protein
LAQQKSNPTRDRSGTNLLLYKKTWLYREVQKTLLPQQQQLYSRSNHRITNSKANSLLAKPSTLQLHARVFQSLSLFQLGKSDDQRPTAAVAQSTNCQKKLLSL